MAGRADDDADDAPTSVGRALAVTVAGIAIITIGGELVAVGADGLIGSLGLGADQVRRRGRVRSIGASATSSRLARQ